MTRLNKVLNVMTKELVDGVVLKDENTIRYVTGFSGDSSLLYIDRNQAVLITDGRYTEQARLEMPKMFKVLEYKPVDSKSIWRTAVELATAGQVNVLGFDGGWFSFNDYSVLKELAGDLPLQSLDLSDIRMVKDAQELELLQIAAKISDEAFMKLLGDIQPGVTEMELAARLEYYMRQLGSEKVSFDTIVASGVRGALPHGMASMKKVEMGELITFDFGAVYKGYHADITRTVMLGMANSWQREIYSLVESAQLRGLKAAKVGMTGKELDEIVRQVIVDCGYGDNFIHGLGHGVGLEIHEMPNINKRGATVLEKGMVFSIEPGIYIPGKGGVRIEDSVVLTDEGAKPLNTVKKQLIEIV
ncbi:MAG: aminopeptidase P family protein [Phascolarctobacterium sp.]|nr:aminopeptidase P family protein [Phascolarctobacterium sp.]